MLKSVGVNLEGYFRGDQAEYAADLMLRFGDRMPIPEIYKEWLRCIQDGWGTAVVGENYEILDKDVDPDIFAQAVLDYVNNKYWEPQPEEEELPSLGINLEGFEEFYKDSR